MEPVERTCLPIVTIDDKWEDKLGVVVNHFIAKQGSGWSRLFKRKFNRIYTALLNQLFRNMRPNFEPLYIKSFFDGVIILSKTSIDAALRVPGEGLKITDLSIYDTDDGVTLLKSLVNPEIEAIRPVEVTELPLIPRALYEVVRRIILWEREDAKFVSPGELRIINCLINGVRIDLPHIMMNRILKTFEDKSAAIPYGPWITVVILEFYGRKVGSRSQAIATGSDVINSNTICGGRGDLLLSIEQLGQEGTPYCMHYKEATAPSIFEDDEFIFSDSEEEEEDHDDPCSSSGQGCMEPPYASPSQSPS